MLIRRTVMMVGFAMLCSAAPDVAMAAQPAPRGVATPAAQAPVNEDARILQDFKERLDRYLSVHRAVAKDAPPLKQTNDPEQILAAQAAFGEQLRQTRSEAKHGDIFSPEIQQKFRQLLAPKLKGEAGQDAKKVLKDDAPAAVPLKVNAKYPPNATLPTMPAKLLLNLPTLPEEVEYRIVNKDLILRDVKGDIIVDFIPNAIP